MKEFFSRRNTTVQYHNYLQKERENDRGIFGLSVLQKIIDKLTYMEKYPLLDENMSDSNIGARKKKTHRKQSFHYS